MFSSFASLSSLPSSHSSGLPVMRLSPSPSSDNIQPSPDSPPPAEPSIEERASDLDHDYKFQIVVFEVYFPSSNEETIT